MKKSNAMTETPHRSIKTGWRSPSNIALVKYWGKQGRQIPCNPSISFTLSKAFTETEVLFTPRAQKEARMLRTFEFGGKPNAAFAGRIEAFLQDIFDEMPFLQEYLLDIRSKNSFPHSAGIASSASAMSALALCLVEGEKIAKGEAFIPEHEIQRVSEIARLGSGSASRSVIPELAVWGAHPEIPGSSDRYAIAFPYEVNEVFRHWKDDIILVSSAEKAVSSSAGHALMKKHIYAESRYLQARENTLLLSRALREGQVEVFGSIVEEEALSLHGLMMNSRPSFMLMLPETVRIIHALRSWRDKHKLPVFFTLDAGPNVHLLYPPSVSDDVNRWLRKALRSYLDRRRILRDETGGGPQRLRNPI